MWRLLGSSICMRAASMVQVNGGERLTSFRKELNDEKFDRKDMSRSSFSLNGCKMSFESSDQEEGAEQRGGVYTAFHGDFFGENSSLDEFEFTESLHEESHALQREPPSPTPLSASAADESNISDEDDGWMSNSEEFSMPFGGPQGNLQPYKTYGYEEWEDEIQAVFASSWKNNPEKVRALMREMFTEHEDVHDLVCFFLRRLGRKRNKYHGVLKVLLEEFMNWKKERAKHLPKNALLTVRHQEEILSLLTRCNMLYLDYLCSIFELCEVPVDQLVGLAKEILHSNHLKEAVTFIFTLGIQEHFKMEQVLIPLVALDKINLIEKYVEGKKELQEEFVSLLDKLCEPDKAETLSQILSDCEIPSNLPNSKLNSRQLHKLGNRFVMKYGLNLDSFPNIAKKKTFGFLHHLLRSHYVDESITADNIEDLLESVVIGKDHQIQMQLICELVQFNDVPAAAKWALRCDLTRKTLPYAVRKYLTDHNNIGKSNECLKLNGSGRDEDVVRSCRYHELTLPLSSVIFVDKRQSLQYCWETILKPDTVIGIDSEWKLVYNTNTTRMAVMQVAVESIVYILDMITLPQIIAPKTLRHFIQDLFGSKHILKLGYSFHSDLRMLGKSWPFVADIISHPQGVVDLMILDKQVNKLLQSSDTKIQENRARLPSHPLLETTPTGSGFPEHLVLMTSKMSVTDEVNSGEYKKCSSGLSLLVERCLGKPLDKSQQLSDWERRPLRDEQMKYAALDAHCLLAVYYSLKTAALDVDPNFNVTPYISDKPHPH